MFVELRDEFGIRKQVAREVGVHADPGKHADRAVKLCWNAPGACQRLPRTFEKNAMLRIHDFSFARIHAEERGGEQICIIENTTRLDEAGIVFGEPNSSGLEFFVAEK